MINNTIIQQLNSAEYLYLRQLSEPRDNSLRLIVEEAFVNRTVTIKGIVSELPEIGAALKGALPIESVEGCRTFELYWKSYAAYLVTEEMVGSCAARGYEDECYSGTLLRVYSSSHFLVHLERDTGAHFNPLQHYKLICLNHLIDIASYDPPEVQLIHSTSTVE